MKVSFVTVCAAIILCLAAAACQNNSQTSMKNRPDQQPASQGVSPSEARDAHSYSNPDQVRVRHVHLDLKVLFDRKALKGTSTLTLEHMASGEHPLRLDTRDLKIFKAEASTGGTNFTPVSFALGEADPILGAPLTIQIPANATKVRIEYESSPQASGVQWLEPAQTAGKKHPYVFTQSQAIHARSWIPLQDSPGVRVTYTAQIRTPKGLRAVMSAEQDANAPLTGDYEFDMPQPIPSYLIALAAGDIAFKSLGARTGVYTEPLMLDKAARELEDTEKMIEATEKLYGPYRWGRYDILVLPPSFPIGGMENPRLTFATPTILAGDKSLVSLVAHELAHSWSGNLVTNATWRDFWLNEGFTTYLERRIIEAIYGRQREEMEAALAVQGLKEEMDKLDARDEILHIDLAGRDPDDGFTGVPYEKGALFLRYLEETFGREKFDQFLKGYFDHFAFQSITTADFVAYLKKNLFEPNPQLAAKVNLDEWLYQPGLPANAPQPKSDAFAKVEAQAGEWLEGKTAAAKLKTKDWSTQEWLHFLKFLPSQLSRPQLEELDRAFNLTKTGNAEIAHEWLLMAIRNKYEPAYQRLEQYLTSIGRQKLIKPLYEELVKTPEGRERALQIYRKARPGYHPIAQTATDKIVKWEKKE
ncbi:MAG TPA: M1 family metallopeptidase [Blastocatellia bacterium]|nr:M1 family metallopeptidase [Blastocatellia bacterium]